VTRVFFLFHSLEKGQIGTHRPDGVCPKCNSAFNKIKAEKLSRNLNDVLDKCPHFWYVNIQLNNSAFSFLSV